MRVSEHGLDLLKQWEGFKTHVYPDSRGLPTIGVGHLIMKDERSSGKIYIKGEPVKYRNGLTEQQVLDLLDQDADHHEWAVNSFVKVPLNQNQYDALVSFSFNVGVTSFERSTLLKLLNQGKYDQVPAQLRRWVHDDKGVSRGLVNRRNFEIDLWNEA